MKNILLSQGKVTIVDANEYERLNKFKWYAHLDKQHWYVERNSLIKNGKRFTIRMHREIMDSRKGEIIDHINGNTLDNRKENLRFCTNQQNAQNRKYPHKNNALNIKGVYWNRQYKKFHARIMINNKSVHLGYFNVLGDADSAYRIAEEKYFIEFSRNLKGTF